MRAGFASYEITPRVGVELYGFGPYLNRRSKGVHSPLEARTAVFEDGNRITAVITCDIGDTSPDIRERTVAMLNKKSPGKVWDVVICASHTHSGPVSSEATSGWGAIDHPYVMLLPAKLCESVLLAVKNISEVMVSYGESECRHIGLNRIRDIDAPPLDEVLKEDWEPAKPELTDTTCRVIRFDDMEGRMKGFIANFGCHPVVCCQANHYITGDYPAVAMRKLMQENPGSVGMFMLGAHGDINSGCVHKPEKESLEALEVFGERFARAIRAALQNAEPMTDETVKCVFLNKTFSTKKIFDREKLLAWREEFSKCFEEPSASDMDENIRFNTVLVRGVDKMLKILDGGKTDVDGVVTGVRIGDIRILAGPCEIMNGIRVDVTSACSAGIPWIVSLCNGSIGYATSEDIADSEDLSHGGYEAIVEPLINGLLPFADIHHELKKYMLEAASMLEKS